MTVLRAIPRGFLAIPAVARRLWILFLLDLRRDLLGTLQLATEGMLAVFLGVLFRGRGFWGFAWGLGIFMISALDELFSDLLSGRLALSIQMREPPRLGFDQ